jgi:predicted membrane protein
MKTKSSSFFSSEAVIGFLLLVFGLAILLENLDLMRAHEVLKYWPLILVVFGLIKMFESGPTGGRIFGLILAIVGLFILLDNLDIMYFHLWDLWPLILVAIGVSMVWRVYGKGAVESGSADTYIRSTAFMGGGKRTNTSKEFRGGELTAVMGGTRLDLRGAQIQGEEAVIDLFAFWGGIEIFVPREWQVDIRVTPLLGGVDDKTEHPSGGLAKRLIVRGTTIMGGAEVKN